MILNVVSVSDQVTEFSAKWNNRLFAELDPISHVDLVREKATRANFEAEVAKNTASMIVFYDHGGAKCLYGSDLQPILDCSNSCLMRGKEVFTMACLSAQKLGAKAYREGCKAYWGYCQPFSFVTDREEVFGTLANMGLILRLKKGYSWARCVEEVKAAYDRVIEELRTVSGAGWAVVALINDRDCLVCWTDQSQPPSDCMFRKTGIFLFGRAGQKMSKTAALSTAFLLSLWTLAIYSYLNLMYDLYGTCTVWDWGYVGLLGVLPASFILLREYLVTLDQR